MMSETGVKEIQVIANGLCGSDVSRDRAPIATLVCRIKNAPQRVRMANKQASIALRIRRRDSRRSHKGTYFIVGITNSA